MTKASDNQFPSVLFAEQGSNPSTPASGFWRAYMKSDGLYIIDDAGNVTGPLGGAATAREDLAAHWHQSATKTDIGTSYVDVYTQTNSQGKWLHIDTNGKTEFRVVVMWNKVGAGTQALRLIDATNTDVLHEFTNLSSGSNDSGLVSIPAAYQNTRKSLKMQAKSTTAGDDPVFEQCVVFLK